MDDRDRVSEFDVERWLHVRSVEHRLLKLRDHGLAILQIGGDGGDIYRVLLRFVCLLPGFELAVSLDEAFNFRNDVLFDKVFRLLLSVRL
jgi:hypothetical protein